MAPAHGCRTTRWSEAGGEPASRNGRQIAFKALRDQIGKDGVTRVLATSAKQDEPQVYKKLLRIGDLVQEETSSDDAEKSKPHPDIFEAAMARLPSMGPADVVVIGDTPYDAQAAGKAGLRTIGVLCGGFTEASLREAGCIAIYRDPADLLARYDGSLLARGRQQRRRAVRPLIARHNDIGSINVPL